MLAAGASAGVNAPETDVHAAGLETSTDARCPPQFVRPFDGVKGYTAAEPGWLERLFVDGKAIARSARTVSSATSRAQTPRVGEAIFAALADELAVFLGAASSLLWA